MQDTNFSIHFEPFWSPAKTLTLSAVGLDQPGVPDHPIAHLDQKLIKKGPERRFALCYHKHLLSPHSVNALFFLKQILPLKHQQCQCLKHRLVEGAMKGDRKADGSTILSLTDDCT